MIAAPADVPATTPPRSCNSRIASSKGKHAVRGAHLGDQRRVAHGPREIDASQFGCHRQVLSHRTVRIQRGNRAARRRLRVARRGREYHEACATTAGEFDQPRPDGSVVVTQPATDGYGRAGGERRCDGDEQQREPCRGAQEWRDRHAGKGFAWCHASESREQVIGKEIMPQDQCRRGQRLWQMSARSGGRIRRCPIPWRP